MISAAVIAFGRSWRDGRLARGHGAPVPVEGSFSGEDDSGGGSFQSARERHARGVVRWRSLLFCWVWMAEARETGVRNSSGMMDSNRDMIRCAMVLLPAAMQKFDTCCLSTYSARSMCSTARGVQ